MVLCRVINETWLFEVSALEHATNYTGAVDRRAAQQRKDHAANLAYTSYGSTTASSRKVQDATGPLVQPPASQVGENHNACRPGAMRAGAQS
jgi:hypothetical protein